VITDHEFFNVAVKVQDPARDSLFQRTQPER
jgi:hypothetical protein